MVLLSSDSIVRQTEDEAGPAALGWLNERESSTWDVHLEGGADRHAVVI